LRKWDVEEVEVNKGESKEGIFGMHFTGVVVYEFYKLGFDYLSDFVFPYFGFFIIRFLLHKTLYSFSIFFKDFFYILSLEQVFYKG
jgi:hypothetical protein